MRLEEIKEKEIKELIEEIMYLLENNIIHCKDVYNVIDKERELLFDMFYNENIDIHLFNAKMKCLNYIEKEIRNNYQDFQDKFKTITLNKKEHIYYKKGKAYEINKEYFPSYII